MLQKGFVKDITFSVWPWVIWEVFLLLNSIKQNKENGLNIYVKETLCTFKYIHLLDKQKIKKRAGMGRLQNSKPGKTWETIPTSPDPPATIVCNSTWMGDIHLV